MQDFLNEFYHYSGIGNGKSSWWFSNSLKMHRLADLKFKSCLCEGLRFPSASILVCCVKCHMLIDQQRTWRHARITWFSVTTTRPDVDSTRREWSTHARGTFPAAVARTSPDVGTPWGGSTRRMRRTASVSGRCCSAAAKPGTSFAVPFGRRFTRHAPRYSCRRHLAMTSSTRATKTPTAGNWDF